jgi:hypothetical protein
MKAQILFAVLPLMLSLACTLTNNLTATPSPAAKTATQESTNTAAGIAVKPDAPALDATLTPDAGTPTSPIVCFANNYDGLVWVRECPSVGCRQIAILPAGTDLRLVETLSTAAGAWSRISSPVEGWMNTHYICGETK